MDQESTEKEPKDNSNSEIEIDREESNSSETTADIDEPDEGNGRQDEDVCEEEETEVKAEPIETESERYLRLAADFDNYKKRTAREFGNLIKTANSRLLGSFIEILDNFERALDDEVTNGGLDGYRKGVELIYNQFSDLLKKVQVIHGLVLR